MGVGFESASRVWPAFAPAGACQETGEPGAPCRIDDEEAVILSKPLCKLRSSTWSRLSPSSFATLRSCASRREGNFPGMESVCGFCLGKTGFISRETI